MKRLLCIMLILLLLCGCNEPTVPPTNDDPVPLTESNFLALITEMHDKSVIVTPLASEQIGCDRLSFGITDLADLSVGVDDVVRIAYTGEIMETYPAQIRAVAWEKASDLRDIAFGESWIEKTEDRARWGNDPMDLEITEIFADCFLAHGVVTPHYTVKVNTVLSDEWCVGDQVYCTFDNFYYDAERYRAEADMASIEVSDFVPDPDVCYKPVIYLYPEEETAVDVRLTLDGELTCTYPAYQNGWQVTAAPDGTLTDKNGQTYNYLYWEGETNAEWDRTSGFCIQGEDTAAFLESALADLGLTRREANEFIVYWLPLMQHNPYNVITFQTGAYTDAAKLDITPAPDTLIRVFMTFSASDTYVDLPSQTLTAPARIGFTAVEWGGTEL